MPNKKCAEFTRQRDSESSFIKGQASQYTTGHEKLAQREWIVKVFPELINNLY